LVVGVSFEVLTARSVFATTLLASLYALTAAGMRVPRCYSDLFAVTDWRRERAIPRGISKFYCLWHAVVIGTATPFVTMCHSNRVEQLD
jgi:hypothetical protein